MPTQTEESQVKDFLKRAEIKTMKKDLRSLREADALKERNKIVKIKTLEEQQAEQQKKIEEKEKIKSAEEKNKREQVLGKNAVEERLAEKDLKEYATEQERQQIFQFEAQRLHFGKQADAIDKEKEPALKLQKNQSLVQKSNFEQKLDSISEQERKLETEQNFIAQKAQQTAIGEEKKSLEKRRWEIDENLQEIEKKRWGVEKQIEDIETKIKEINTSSEQLAQERNLLKQKILGIDKSLREIYSSIIANVEEKRRNEAKEQSSVKGALAEQKAEQRGNIQRQQWGHQTPSQNQSFSKIPVPVKEKATRTFQAEEEQRKKFLQDVDTWSQDKNSPLPSSSIAFKQPPQTPQKPIPPKNS